MARKTITIDAEAYERLRLARRGTESMSETIKRVVRPLTPISNWLERIGDVGSSDAFADAVNEQIASRSVTSPRRFKAVSASPARKKRVKRASKSR
jgi:predicted CopG family antitoxin